MVDQQYADSEKDLTVISIQTSLLKKKTLKI